MSGDRQTETLSSVQQGGQDGQSGTRPDLTSLPLQGSACFHAAVHPVCAPPPRVQHTSLGTMDRKRRTGARKGTDEGRGHGVRARWPGVQGEAGGAGTAVTEGEAAPGRHVPDAQDNAWNWWPKPRELIREGQ